MQSKKTLIIELVNFLNQGLSVIKALSAIQPDISPLISALVKASEESGDLSCTLNTISIFCKMQDTFSSQIRLMLLMPAITFLFFLGITLFIIIMIIIPQFATLYAVMHQEVTGIIYYLILFNQFLYSWMAIPLCLILLLLLLALYKLFTIGIMRTFIDLICSYIPIFSNLKKLHFQSYFFYGLGAQLGAGISTLNALSILTQDAPAGLYKRICLTLQNSINQGNSISSSLEQYDKFFNTQAIGLIKLGQESGRLNEICTQLGDRYQNDLLQILNRLPLIIQPLIILILGLLVTMLILSIYGPIINLSNSF